MKKIYVNPELYVEEFNTLEVLGASNPITGTTDGTDDWAESPNW